jgi:plasmid stabilization system protein ParE
VARVVYSAAALADFERIIEFALQAHPTSAPEMVTRIRTAVEILETHPLIGRRRDESRRELAISQGRSGYVALYRYDVAEQVVRILRLRHQREAGFLD